MHASKFPKYPDMLPTYQLAADPKRNELFVGQKFVTKEDCVFAIKQYSMNVLIDYKVILSKPILYMGSVRGWQEVAIGGYEMHLSRDRKCGSSKNLLGLTHALQHV
ncbi:hypothetical protein PVK06_028331 [Gossypium arboreum]|uniref:Uncharacterized protein n=1 Tax=Gossypium arboreum TaxID=29729 RepID=A0ABR0P346_GOSAR|nr:hypothetical protein PVK06_028331 [Gossypium arboreum]